MGAVLNTGTIKGYSGPVTEIPDDRQSRFQALHHMLIASAKVVKFAHAHYPHFKLGCMTLMGATYPLTPDPDDMLKAQSGMNISNWYTSDVQVRGRYPYFAERLPGQRYHDHKRARRRLTVSGVALQSRSVL